MDLSRQRLYDLIRWGSESQEGYAPAYCRICGAILSTFDKTAPIGERLRWNGCEHIEAARKAIKKAVIEKADVI